MLKAVLCNSISPFTISGTDEQVQLLKMTKNEVRIKPSCARIGDEKLRIPGERSSTRSLQDGFA